MFSSIKIIITFLFTLSVLQAFAQERKYSLAEIKRIETSTLTRLEEKNATKEQKLTLAKQVKDLIEDNLKDLITDGIVDPADLSLPDSDLSIAFQNLDFLTLIAQLEIEPTGKISQAKCNESKAMMQLSLGNPTSDGLRKMSLEENKTLQILQGLCE